MTERDFIVIEIDYCVSLSDIQKYTDIELCELFLYASQDKREIFRADCTFWMCVMEINRRKNDEWPVEMNVISYVNVYDENEKAVFKYGNPYQLFVIDGTVLVYDDNWIPNIFGCTENDEKWLWKYFCVSIDEKTASKIY